MDTFWGLTSTGWTAIYTFLTAALLGVAVAAARYAKRQWEASRIQIEDSRQAQLEASRPYVIVTVEPSGASRALFDLVVRNIGRRPALNVMVRLNPPPRRANEDMREHAIADSKMLNEPIAMIAPDQELRTFYDSHISRHGSEDLSTFHNVSLRYNDSSGRVYTESSVLDLDAMRGTTYIDVKTVHDIGKSLDEIKKVLKNASLLSRTGGIHVEAVTETRAQRAARNDLERYKELIDERELERAISPDGPHIAKLDAEIENWEARHIHPPTESPTTGSA